MLATSVDENHPALTAIRTGLATLSRTSRPHRSAVIYWPVRFVAAGHTLADHGTIGLTCPSIFDTGQVRIHAALLAEFTPTHGCRTHGG